MNYITKNVYHFLLSFFKKQRLAFLLIAFSATIAGLLNNSILPYLLGQLIDAFFIIDHDRTNVFKDLSNALTLTLFCWVLMECMQRAKGILLANTAPYFEANIRMFVFNSVIQHTYEYFTQKHTGAIAHRIDDLPRSAKLIIDDVLTVFLPLTASIVMSSIAIFQHDSILAAAFFLWLILYFSLCVFFCNRSAHYSSLHAGARAAVQGVIVDSLTNHLSVKIFTGHHHEESNVKKAQSNEITKYKRSLMYIEKFKILLCIISICSVSALVGFAIHIWQLGQISVGELIFIVNTTMTLMTVIWFASDEISYMFYEIGICRQALLLIQEPVSNISDQGAVLKIQSGKIEFKNVTFHYQQSDNIFCGKSLTINGGQKVGLVGFSGSGKTTFTHLIMRLYEIFSGSIEIDGQDIAKVNLKSLRGGIAFIPQEPLLFHRSIMDNIRYGRFDASDEEVIEAAKKAEAHHFIMRMPEKYDAMVGEKGSKLSGGQKQRIAIARAFLKNASIIIMDEATSALDSVTEKILHKSLNELMKNKTVIVIAHRLSTLLDMDRILVFHQGNVIEDGAHDELIARGGHYATLWKMQHNGVLPASDIEE